MDPSQEKSIVSNIVALKKRTVNISVLLTKLVQHNVLILIEKDAVLGIQDDEQRMELLYEIIMRKSPEAFGLLLKCLRESGNTSLAGLLEESWSKDGTDSGSQRRLRRGSSTDRYLKEDVGSNSVQDYEMGIAEILEENDKLRKNWKLILFMLNLSEAATDSFETSSSFIFKTTIMLRKWIHETKMRSTLGNLCGILDKNGYSESSARIRKMFEVYSEESQSGFLFQFQLQANIPIHDQELEICKVLEDNPDFGLNEEKLFLLLNLPISYFPQFVRNHSNFLSNAVEMLHFWNETKSATNTRTNNCATYFDLATLIMKNGHRTTAGKICLLSTI